MGEKKVFLVANAHLDPVWQWEFDEGIAAALSTFRSAATLAEQYNYIFCHNEALLYEWIEKNDSELFERIRASIKKDRWRVMGGWYLQPDCNMISGESFIRQIAAGRHYFSEKFGVKPWVAVNVDSFGHSRGMVQILAKCGFRGYIVGRPSEDEFHPGVSDFWWNGLDGSRIRVVRIPSYSTTMGIAARQIEEAAQKTENSSIIKFWGVGNHGGGPSRKDLEEIQSLQKNSKNINYKHSFPEEYFKNLSEDAPNIEESLHPSMPACYISQSRIKRMHRKLENLLDLTEKMMATAYANGIDWPCIWDAIDVASKDLMLAQFHDILAGTCVKRAEEDALMILAHGVTELKRSNVSLMISMSKGLQAPLQSYPFIVFNPHPYPLRCVLESECILAAQNWDNYFTGIDMYCGANKIPSQIIKEDSNIPVDWRKRIAFIAELQPMSVTAFYGVEKKCPGKNFAGRALDKFQFKNKYYSAEIGCDGKLNSIFLNGRNILTGGCSFAVYSDDEDSWGIRPKKRERIGIRENEYILANQKESAEISGTMSDIAPMRLIEDGEILSTAEAVFVHERSHLIVQYTFYKEFDYIDIRIKLHQQSKNELLKFEVPVSFGEYYGEIPFGYEKLKAGGCENVSLRWTGMFSDIGVAVLNDGVYGSSYENGRLCISLSRSAAYAGHPLGDASVLSDDRAFPRMDQGELEFRFRILFSEDGQALLRSVTKRAQAFNIAPYCLQTMPAGGEHKIKSVLELSNAEITVEAFRRLKDAYELHLHNNNHQEAVTKLFFMGEERAELRLKPFEVKAIYLTEDEIRIKDELI